MSQIGEQEAQSERRVLGLGGKGGVGVSPNALRFLQLLAQHVLDEWNSQGVERVVSVYTADVTYVDPSTIGSVKGDALRRYLTGQTICQMENALDVTGGIPFRRDGWLRCVVA